MSTSYVHTNMYIVGQLTVMGWVGSNWKGGKRERKERVQIKDTFSKFHTAFKHLKKDVHVTHTGAINC